MSRRRSGTRGSDILRYQITSYCKFDLCSAIIAIACLYRCTTKSLTVHDFVDMQRVLVVYSLLSNKLRRDTND